MTSITTFAYGLTVLALELVAAAAAWPRLDPVFRFFDLVYLRRKKGSLAGSSSSVIIPVEVWERVKRYLVTTELEDAVDSIVREALKPDECQKRDCLESDKRRYSWGRFFAMEGECDSCDSRRYDWVANLVDGEHEFDERIQDLVSTFGLAHPLDRFIRLDPENLADGESLALVSIPKQYHDTDSILAPTFSNSTPDLDLIHKHAIVEVDFSLPSDSDLRFIRFVRTFSLEIVNVKQITQAPLGPRAAAAIGRGEAKDELPRALIAEQSEIGAEVTREIKPIWRLYSVVLDRVE